jgi:hypothetical protein
VRFLELVVISSDVLNIKICDARERQTTTDAWITPAFLWSQGSGQNWLAVTRAVEATTRPQGSLPVDCLVNI